MLKKGWLSIIILILLLGIIIFMNQNENTNKDTRPEVSFYAPEFSLQNINDNNVTLSQYKGKPIFINFWASWCPPCIEEMPAIQEAYNKFGDQVIILGINLTSVDDKETAINFMKQNGYDMPILFDYDGNVGKLYRANNIPTSYFIDAKGIIRAKHIGAMSFSQIESYLQRVIGGM